MINAKRVTISLFVAGGALALCSVVLLLAVKVAFAAGYVVVDRRPLSWSFIICDCKLFQKTDHSKNVLQHIAPCKHAYNRMMIVMMATTLLQHTTIYNFEFYFIFIIIREVEHKKGLLL